MKRRWLISMTLENGNKLFDFSKIRSVKTLEEIKINL